MACGGCSKKKGIQINREVTVPIPKSRPMIPSGAVKVPTPVHKVTTTAKSLLAKNNTVSKVRCPMCSTVLRRVARPGQGEFLQCSNPKCGYVRKNR